jgi:hypothetical protein
LYDENFIYHNNLPQGRESLLIWLYGYYELQEMLKRKFSGGLMVLKRSWTLRMSSGSNGHAAHSGDRRFRAAEPHRLLSGDESEGRTVPFVPFAAGQLSP